MSSATLRKILSYVLPWTAVLMLAYPPTVIYVIYTIRGFTVLFRFPIPEMLSEYGEYGEYGEYLPLTKGARIRLSIIYYQFMLAMFATIPLYRTKRFEDSTFYSAYKMFWWFNAPIYSMILLILIGTPTPLSSAMTIAHIKALILCVIYIAIPSAIILMLTLTPAYFQHKSKHDKP